MSRKNFLNEINKMSRKGIYPSLSILLEKDDFSFGDDDNDSDTPSDDSSDSTETDDSSEPAETGEPASPSPEDDVEAASLAVDQQVKEIENLLNILNNEPKVDVYKDKYTPSSSIFDNKNYSLKNFVILEEDAKNLETTLKKIDDMLKKDKNKETIKQLKIKTNDLQSGDPNFKSKIPSLVIQSIENLNHFDAKYCKASIVASDIIDGDIKNQSESKDLEANIKEYIYQLAKKLDQNKIKHALNVSATVDNDDFKNAKGGFNRG
jgi:hypothetical protein